MRRFRRVLTTLGLAAAGIWLVACVTLIVFARQLIYPFEAGYSAAEPAGIAGARAAVLEAGDGVPLTVWLKDPAPGAPVVLFFMGNGGVLQSHAPLLAQLAERGFGVAALNYRGAGGAPGAPSQAAITADAQTLYDGLDALLDTPVGPGRRVIWGTSLGAAVAVQLAARREAGALVLESPFNRLCEAAQVHYPIFPVCLILPYERWDSAAAISGVETPLLILHGEVDTVIPISLGRKLFAAAPGQKRMIAYEGKGHNDLDPAATARDAATFLAEALGG